METALKNLGRGCRQVLDVLCRGGPASRAEIAAATGYTRPAITQMVRELTDVGILSEGEARRGQRGQPARPVAFRRDAGYSVGVNFSATYLDVAIVDLSGGLIAEARASLAEPTPGAVAALAETMIESFREKYSIPLASFLGVGISIPGDFDVDGSILPHRVFPGFAGRGVFEEFQSLISLPVFLENDGRVCAIGERVMGAGRAYRTFMLVHLGHGIGGGIIINGTPYRGAIGNAGILGQYYPYDAPRPSGLDLLETLQRAGYPLGDFDALEHFDLDQKIVNDWAKRAAEQLGGVIARIGRFFGPDAIIIAGRLPPKVIDRLVANIDLPAALRHLDQLPTPALIASPLGASAGLLGAAAVPIFKALLPQLDN